MPAHMKSLKKECIGPECEGCSSGDCYAKGGDVFEDRETKGASDPEKNQSGVHESSRFGSKGVSMAGEDQRAGFDTKPAHKKVLSEMKAMPKPELMAEGGEVDEGDDELHDMLGEELMDAFHSKDKKRAMSAIEACVMRCMNKGDD